MALTCEGDVYVLHDRPENLLYEPKDQPTSIWLTHELPVLKRLYRLGFVTKLTVIPTTGPAGDGTPATYDPDEWKDGTAFLKQDLKRDIEWTEEMIQYIKHRKEELRSQRLQQNNGTEHESLHLEERWQVCSGSAADQEDPHLDYFG
jgi:hypothetical protein